MRLFTISDTDTAFTMAFPVALIVIVEAFCSCYCQQKGSAKKSSDSVNKMHSKRKLKRCHSNGLEVLGCAMNVWWDWENSDSKWLWKEKRKDPLSTCKWQTGDKLGHNDERFKKRLGGSEMSTARSTEEFGENLSCGWEDFAKPTHLKQSDGIGNVPVHPALRSHSYLIRLQRLRKALFSVHVWLH